MSYNLIPDALIRRFVAAFEPITPEAAAAYERAAPLLTCDVNEALSLSSGGTELLGHLDPASAMSNHENHGRFMAAAFHLRSPIMLLQTVAWVYASYIQRGVRPEYFPAELEAWRNAVTSRLPPREAEPIARFYDTMRDSHEDFLSISQQMFDDTTPRPEYHEAFDAYLSALLAPDTQAALQLAQTHIQTPDDLAAWWLDVIQPVMYEIGEMWARGAISVGQEHLATSITQRVMSAMYPLLLDIPHDRGVLAVVISPGELHEIGPRMLSDLLEINGWDVHFTGASTPPEGLSELLLSVGAQGLCLSTTLSPNLPQAAEIIRIIRSTPETSGMRVLVGGQAYKADTELWRRIDAEAYARTPTEAIALLG